MLAIFSYSQIIHGSPKVWVSSPLVDDIRKWIPSESERTNSVQAQSSSNKIYSETTESSTILSNRRRIHGSNDRMQLASTNQSEDISKRFSEETSSYDRVTLESFCRTEDTRKSGKCTSILSTIPLTSQKSTISEGSENTIQCSTDFESSLSYKFNKNQQIIDFFNNFEKPTELYQRTNVLNNYPELSETTSTSNRFSEISNYPNLGKQRKLSDVEEAQMEQSSSVEEELKMKIVLMPKPYQTLDKHIGIEQQQSDRESNPSRSISSYNSTATTTTYESTQDLSTIRS